jgi:membrane-associated protein
VPDLDVAREIVSGSWWTYLAITGVVALDCVFPVAPGETVVITAGIFAASGDLLIWLVLAAALAGSLLGDNASYWLGRKVGRPLERRLARRRRAREMFDWARHQLRVRGGVIIVAARFIPGGRTATTFSSGALEYPWRERFLPVDALAATIWAVYATALGYIGGSTFKDNLLAALSVSFVLAALFTVAGELYRRTALR